MLHTLVAHCAVEVSCGRAFHSLESLKCLIAHELHECVDVFIFKLVLALIERARLHRPQAMLNLHTRQFTASERCKEGDVLQTSSTS